MPVKSADERSEESATCPSRRRRSWGYDAGLPIGLNSRLSFYLYMNQNTIWWFVVILVLGSFYVAFFGRDCNSCSNVFEYMSALSLAFIACALMYIASKMKKK